MGGVFGTPSRGDTAARVGVALNRFDIMRIDALDAAEFGAAAADYFVDETGVDTAASSDQTYEASGDYYHNTAVDIDVLAGGTPGESGHASSDVAANAFDNTTARWQNNNTGAFPHSEGETYIEYTPPASYACKAYTITADTGSVAPEAWKVKGYDGAEWVDIDARSAQTGWSTGEARNFVVNDATEYEAFRLDITDSNHGDTVYVREWEMTAQGTAPDMVLISEAFTAASAPGAARVVLLIEDIDAPVLNTDLVAAISRDDGSNWTAATLSDAGVYSGALRVLTGDASLAGQPSDTDMRWRVTMANGVAVKIHAAALIWG